MELKFLIKLIEEDNCMSSNRTFMELKFENLKEKELYYPF